MLTELHIENLGVIERASLALAAGATALTGETGAGKTMLVEAIELLVGGRADAMIVRSGASEARVDGRLVLAGGEELVLSRVVPADGRSRAYVNGRPATVAQLGELTRGLIELHGQHAHQTLLAVAAQRSALDEYGGVDLEPLRQARARITELDAELASLGGDAKSRAREIDLLRYQLGELDAAALEDAEEEARLAADEELLADAVAHRQAANAAVVALSDDGGTGESLGAALAALAHRAPFAAVEARLRGVIAEVDDVASELRALAESIDDDPARLGEVRQRRQLLKDLCRKYGDDLGEVIAFRREAADRLAELEGYEARAVELDRRRGDALAGERAAAAAVGVARRRAAPGLGAAIEARLRTLAMPAAAVAVEVGAGPDDDPGDDVRFLLSANPGSPLLPLSRVASGGELARAMLAVRLELIAHGPGTAATLVFDEVDAGIGGATAHAVGQALAELGSRHQVLVVTHLPQVAACADHQLVVDKTVAARKGPAVTTTTVTAVEGDQRVSEIARMLSGSVTEAARQHASDLLGA